MHLEDLVIDIHILLINEINNWILIRSLNKYWKQLADNVEKEADNPIMVTKKSILSYLETQPEKFSCLKSYNCLIIDLTSYIKQSDCLAYNICRCFKSNCQYEGHYQQTLLSYREFIKEAIYDSYGLLYTSGTTIFPGYEFINHAIKLHPLSANNKNFRNKRLRITIEKYFNLL